MRRKGEEETEGTEMRGTSGGPEDGQACLCTHTCTHASNESGPGPSAPLPCPCPGPQLPATAMA